MSMRPPSLPLPSFQPLRTARVRAARIFTPVLALGLFLPGNSVRAEAPDSPSNADAYHALMDGRVEDATAMLRSTLAANPADADAHQLLCRVFLAQNEAENAIHQCELAASSEATDNIKASDDQLWLGRAYGMKARHAGPVGGFSLARKVQKSFGGDDKAQALAARMMPRFPAAAHHLLARLATANNDLPTAEAEFKRAVAVQNSADAWIDLALFYQTHARPDDALAAIKSGLAADRSHGPVLVDAATVLTAAHRAPDLAERCLRDYLASHAKSDAAPAFKVHLQLSRLLAARGDSQDANRELEAVAALAPAFAHSAKPAQSL